MGEQESRYQRRGGSGRGAGGQDRFEKVLSEPGKGEPTEGHMQNFLQAVKSRDRNSLHAEIAIGAHSAAYCHLANIAYRTGRMLRMDKTGRFVNDAEANAMLTRKYRAPYVVTV